jgi:4'-phosphopantetheinyl transferase
LKALAPGVHTSESFSAERLAGGVDVWLAEADTARDLVVLGRCGDLLTREERESCAAFHHEVDRRRAVVSRALVRSTLSRYAPVPPEEWRFERGPHGRPEIAAPKGPPLRFNLSHTRDLVACVVTLAVDVGVDLERTTGDLDELALARSVFSSGEIAALRSLTPPARRRRFLEIWTLKEAYLKARGMGLALLPSSLDFDLAVDGRIIGIFEPEAGDDPADWWFGLLEAGSDHLLALALKHPGRPERLALFRVSAPATLLSVPEPILTASS